MKKFLIRKIKSWFFFEVWNVKISTTISNATTTNRETWLPIKSKIEFNADPFIIEIENKLYVFVEKYSYLNKIGHIYCYIMDCNLNILEEFIAIKEKYHLSYPQLFEYNNEFYMMPESSQANQTWIYRATEFPYKWEKFEIVFNNKQIIDSNIFFYQSKWWLFYSNLLPNKNNICEFNIMFSDKPIGGQWVVHQSNPIYLNNTNARMAGQVNLVNNKLHRPAQYCKNSYGEKIDIYRIDTLNETTFQETIIDSIQPTDELYNQGCHHISYSKNFLAIDYKRFIFCWYKIAIRLLRKLIKLGRAFQN